MKQHITMLHDTHFWSDFIRQITSYQGAPEIWGVGIWLRIFSGGFTNSTIGSGAAQIQNPKPQNPKTPSIRCIIRNSTTSCKFRKIGKIRKNWGELGKIEKICEKSQKRKNFRKYVKNLENLEKFGEIQKTGNFFPNL